MNEIYIRALVVLVLVSIGFGTGWKVATWRSDAEALKEREASIAALQRSEDHRREMEAGYTKALSIADENYQQSLRRTKNALDAAIAGNLRSGMFVHADCGNNTMPGTSTSTSSSDATSRVKLSNDDAEFLLRFASNCDSTADQLRAAQQVIKADRGTP